MPEEPENEAPAASEDEGQEERVASRARSLDAEQDVPDPEAEARALLEDSDERQEDPATRDLDDDGVIRRTSEETTPPVEPD